MLRPSGLPLRSLAEVGARLGTEARGAGSRDLDEPVVSGVSLDSRAVRPGDLYAAPAGSRAHGADFAAAAAAAGAVACLTDEAGAARSLAAGLATYVVPAPRAVLGGLAAWVYGEPADDLTLIGITGTNGKTTTAHLLDGGLRAAGLRTGLVGTIETRVGDDVLPSVRTTPEAPELQALLAVMREHGVRAVAMEVSSHALAMGRVDGTTYDVAVFTNLSEDHLDFHADLEDYFAVKATLFTPARSRLGVIDVDDAYGRRLVGLATVPVVTVSPSGGAADWRVEDVELRPDGGRFVLAGPDALRLDCSTALAGDFNLANAALAVVALVQAGVDPRKAAAGVASCPGVPGRMERVEAGADGPLALVDFAHSPDALRAAARHRTGAGRRRWPARRRPRLRRGPRPGQAAGYGCDRGARCRCRRPHQRQPALRGPAADHRRGPRGRGPGAGRGRRRAGRGRAGPADRHPAGSVAGRARRRARGGRQGSRDRPGGGRGRPPVRRPRGARRGAPGGHLVSRLSLAEIAQAVGGTVGGGDPSVTVAVDRTAVDSRAVEPGGLFVAVDGERVDGHDFVAAAVAGGAVAALVARDVPEPHVQVDDPVPALGRLARGHVDALLPGLAVVGVTGSSGKTSTKDLLAAVLEPLGPTVAPRGSLNTEVGVPITALRADVATRHLVVEMGARGPGHVAELCRITPPRIGVVLNIGAAHAGEFGSPEATARAKSELVAALPSAAEGGVAVLNADDPLVAAMSEVTAARVVRFGLGPDADVRAVDVRLDGSGRPTFTLRAGDRDPVEVALPLHGAHHVSNALAAAAVGLELGATPADVSAALATAVPRSRWRMEVVERADGVTVVNDAYNANPDSVRAALAALTAIAGERRSWAVLGEMLELGAASTAEHEQVGRLARRSGVGRLVVVGEGARAVHTGALAEGAVDGEGSVVVADVRAALDLLSDAVQPGDVVLVKASRSSGLEKVAEGLLAEAGR